ncbi:helix-turn-helix domain-containing protein [Vibrio jasicida]|uniref:helix-turn-helix domain-containing protein n=1 Tax=Vibrio jasicida TaxID=766224 RepID=UPI000CE4D5B2|nr:helix-turn-helix transcriptional regulator [Vibrio jasicida]
MDDNFFSLELRGFRKKLGFTQQEMVDFIRDSNPCYFDKLDVVSFHRWESGRVKPSIFRQAKILETLGKDTLIKRLSKSKSEMVIDYFESYATGRYDSINNLDLVYLDKSKIYSFDNKGLSDYPVQLIDFQERIIGTENPDEYFKVLEELSSFTGFTTYCNKHNIYCGHLTYMSLPKKNVDIGHNIVEPYMMSDNEDNYLFIPCMYASEKNIFFHQIIKVIEMLYFFPEITEVYFRIYDSKLMTMFDKVFNTHVSCKGELYSNGIKLGASKYKWVGLGVDSTSMKLAYEGVKNLTEKHSDKVIDLVRKCC